MSDEDFDQLVVGSSLFKQYQAERESIARHQRRIEKSEHRDVDFNTALVDWMLKRRQTWLSERAQSEV